MDKYQIYVDGVYHFTFTHDETIEYFNSEEGGKLLNIIRHRSNGFSHDWVEIVPFTEKYLIQQKPIRILATTKKTGIVANSHTISFS